ncbi:MAG TPA: ABC transporter permease [Dermatophilaceae bacterium]|nr:ABC transporter permease [Dermatophilaceae bacterium]
MFTSTTGRVAAVWNRRPILWILVRRDLRVRYARSILGYLWTILDPLAMALIYFMVFAVIFDRSDAGHQPYFLFLLVGLLSWQWFSSSVAESARALLAEAKLVRSSNLPREMWVVRVVIAKGVEYVLSLPVLALFLLVYLVRGEATLTWRLVLFPMGLALQFLVQVGIGLLLAPTTVLVEDTVRVVRIVLRMAFYCTPIIYSLDRAPWWLERLLWLNPLSGVLELYRAGMFPDPIQWQPLAISVTLAVTALVGGLVLFARLERAVLKEI